jgi:hypothetical protein
MSSGQDHGNDHHRYADDLASYALGALPELEAAVVARHVMRCNACAGELERLRPAVEALQSAVPQEPAPPALKSAVMRAVREDAARRAGGPETMPAAVTWRGAFGQTLARLRRRPALGLATAFALLLAIAIGVAGIATLRPAEQRRVVAAAVDTSELPGARARLVARDDVGVLEVARLPHLIRGEVYVVWVDRGRGPAYASSFNVRPDGSGQAAVADLAGVERVMVTREASTAVTHPTTSPLLTVALDS